MYVCMYTIVCRGHGITHCAVRYHSHSAEADSVVSALSADEHDLAVPAPGAVEGQCNLQRGVDGRGAAHGEEDLREALLGQQLQNLLREGVRQRVRGVEAGGEVQPNRGGW